MNKYLEWIIDHSFIREFCHKHAGHENYCNCDRTLNSKPDFRFIRFYRDVLRRHIERVELEIKNRGLC